jgi:hypothetical protein
MWLKLSGESVTVDARRYIAAQPVEYEQVEDVIETIRRNGKPVRARVNLADVRLRDVDLMGVVRIIWELHEHTMDEPLLESLTFQGASVRVLHLWNAVQSILPEFVVRLVKFDSFRDELGSDENEDEWDQDECHQP